MEQLEASAIPAPVASCPRHPGQHSQGSCRRCGDYVCQECAVHAANAEVFCPVCAASFELPSAALHRRFFGNMIDYLGFWGAFTLASKVHYMLAFLVALMLLGVNLTMLHFSGLTLGKLLVGTRLVTKDDARVPLWRVLLIRSPVYLLGTFSGLVIIDALFIFGTSRRTLHDLAAGTRVVSGAESAHLYAD